MNLQFATGSNFFMLKSLPTCRDPSATPNALVVLPGFRLCFGNGNGGKFTLG